MLMVSTDKVHEYDVQRKKTNGKVTIASKPEKGAFPI
jgi:hypothetical protein